MVDPPSGSESTARRYVPDPQKNPVRALGAKS
jgi:hypothetical protein